MSSTVSLQEMSAKSSVEVVDSAALSAGAALQWPAVPALAASSSTAEMMKCKTLSHNSLLTLVDNNQEHPANVI